MIFTPNAFATGTDIDVPVAEGYTHNLGPVQAMIDNMSNHNAIFEALIANDFSEIQAGRNPELFTESEIQTIYEASTGGFIQKVIDFAKKCWEKIKGFFKSFWDTIRAMLTRDNKELVNKFKGQVLKKDLSKMKYKYATPTGNVISTIKAGDSLTGDIWNNHVVGALKMSYNATTAEIQKVRDEVNSQDFKEQILGSTIGQSSVSGSDYAKEAHEYMFNDVEEHEGLSTSDLTNVMTYLSESSKLIKDVKKNEDDVNKVFKKMLSDLDKARNAINKNIPTDKSGSNYTGVKSGDNSYGVKTGNNEERAKSSLAISLAYDTVNITQSVFNTASGALFSNIKYAIKQSRSVFVAAVRYNPKAVKESNMMFEHYADESNYEFDMVMEGVGF